MSHIRWAAERARLPIFLHYSGIFRIFAPVVRLNFSLISFMKIKIIAVGKIKEKFLKDGIDEFLKRLTPYATVEIVELSPVEIKDENLTQKAL